MTDGSTAMPSNGDEEVEEDLSPAHLDVYWYFANTVSRRGTVRATRSQAQNDFGLKWAQLKALMQEIEDAGYWRISDNGTPVLDPEKVPPRPWRPWQDDLDVAPAAQDAPASPTHDVPAPEHGRASTEAISLNKPEQRRLPYGENSSRRQNDGGVVLRTPKAQTRLIRRYSRDSYQLVEYFQYKVRKTNGGFAPDPINCDALGANIKRWIALDDMSYDLIKTMIDLFVAQMSSQRKGSPAWKLFLAQREKLHTQALDRMKDKQRSKPSGKSSWAGYMKREKNGDGD